MKYPTSLGIPNLGGKHSSFLSMSEQLMPPDIAGIN